MKRRGLLNKSINISLNKNPNICYSIEAEKMSISSFHIISLLELLVAIATGVLTRPERKHNYLLPLANEAPHKILL